jgi:hypothetical protein
MLYTPVGTDLENLRENLKYKKGYGTGKQLLAKAKEKGINVSDTTDAAAFANKFKIPVKQKSNNNRRSSNLEFRCFK